MKQCTFDEEMKEMFGGKVYRLSLSSGCSCPNRDGRIGTGGCIFCSAGGSGEFAAGIPFPQKAALKASSCTCPVTEHTDRYGYAGGDTALRIDAALCSLDAQIEEAKKKVASKLSKNFAGYMAYFQSFSNTYGPADRLEKLFSAALDHDDILALSVATRPDCLPPETVDILARLNRKKPVWVELGLQTVHEDTARLISRGYRLPVFEDALRRLKAAGLRVVVHVIIGLPGEDAERTKQTVSYLSSLKDSRNLSSLNDDKNSFRSRSEGTGADAGLHKYCHSISPEPEEKTADPEARCLIDGIKLQMMQVLKGTKLAELKEQDPGILPEYTLEEYAALLKELLEILPASVTVHRLTGDPPKSLLISPLWTADKKNVLNTIRRKLS